MSSTRHAAPGSPMRPDRYASHPAYVALRPICGIAAAHKLALVKQPQHRRLILYVQGLSLKPDVFNAVPETILKWFPEDLAVDRRKNRLARLMGEAAVSKRLREGLADSTPATLPEQSAQEAREWCIAGVRANIGDFLRELCVNPDLTFPTDSECSSTSISIAMPYLRDPVATLLKYQARRTEELRKDFVMTSVAEKVFSMLDCCRDAGRIGLFEGPAGWGKSTPAAAWCEMNPDKARFVPLQGVLNRTAFFRENARACGVSSGYGYKCTELQTRVEDFYARTGIMPVLDQAHMIFGQGIRISHRPELADWLYTALEEKRVPCGLISTPEFSSRCVYTMQQTGWESAQLERRIYPHVFLSENDKPTVADLMAVAAKLLPELNKTALKRVVGYACAARFMDSLRNVAAEVRRIAGHAGRDVTDADVQAAIAACEPSETARRQTFERLRKEARGNRRGGRRSGATVETIRPVPDPESINRGNLLVV